ncbi:MAG: class I adenylate-forming enzyme family protein, partial [Actinomycetota bacterium]
STRTTRATSPRSSCGWGASDEHGIGAGDVVTWQLPTWWEALVLTYACWWIGAIPSPITPTLREREVGYITGATDSRLHVAPHAFRGTDYPGLARTAGYEGPILVVRGAVPLPTGDPPPVRRPDPDEAGVILWTSGTTSDPKGVVHTHRALHTEAVTIAEAHELRVGDPMLLPMPVTHIAGFTYGGLLPVTSGVNGILLDVWDPGRALALIADERIAVIISTPVFLRTMLDHPDFATRDHSSLRLFSLGGAGVAPAMIREGTTTLGCRCKRTYGSTEYPTLSTGGPDDDLDHDATTDGRLIGAGEVRIVDPTTGADLAPGTPGELLVRGPEMFSGYLDPALDAAAFADGGWFRTGDLAAFDGTHLVIVDRLKDIIIRGGENISALEVESALVNHPAVAEAACVAMPDAVMGEKVCAFVIPAPGATPELAGLRAHLLSAGLARFKLPERLEVRTDLPRTASGKVRKAPLRDELRAG